VVVARVLRLRSNKKQKRRRQRRGPRPYVGGITIVRDRVVSLVLVKPSEEGCKLQVSGKRETARAERASFPVGKVLPRCNSAQVQLAQAFPQRREQRRCCPPITANTVAIYAVGLQRRVLGVVCPSLGSPMGIAPGRAGRASSPPLDAESSPRSLYGTKHAG
jgi:hypothetical protein